MAILKHFSVHNRNYHAAVMYLMYEHDGHARPVYDEHGWMIERENLLIDCLNTDLYTYAFDCALISRKYGKNRSDRDVKSHHWILSFDPKDVSERGLTVEKAHQLGMEFAQKHFSGFHTIVATHQDRNNGAGNIHCHIVFGSVRCKDVPQPRYSELERAQEEMHSVPAQETPVQPRQSSEPQPHHGAPESASIIGTPQTHYAPEPDEDFFLYGRIIDLNDPKVQASYGLAQWAKIQNLKENARRFAFLSENGLLNVDRLAEETDRTRKEFFQKQTQQKAVENRLQDVNTLLRAMSQFYKTLPVYDEHKAIKNPRKKAKFRAEHEGELNMNESAVNQIRELRKSMGIDRPTFPDLKKEKAALLRERERLNTQRKALKESYQGLSEGYRAIEEQTRQQQRQRTRQYRRGGFNL